MNEFDRRMEEMNQEMETLKGAIRVIVADVNRMVYELEMMLRLSDIGVGIKQVEDTLDGFGFLYEGRCDVQTLHFKATGHDYAPDSDDKCITCEELPTIEEMSGLIENWNEADEWAHEVGSGAEYWDYPR
jgi:hypothetical protein